MWLRPVDLYLPIQSSIKLLASSRDSDTTLAHVSKFSSSDESSSGLCHLSRHFNAIHKYILTDNFLAASLIFSTLVSEKPLILRSRFVVVEIRVCTRSASPDVKT